ncbi:hypothetical protein QE403_002579 [Chryseobacterium sp. SORGH_AS 1048]|nr:hypothetical protein [Chryseobacterium sp. SORGH_AS_1048]
MKNPSRYPMKLACSLSLVVTSPIDVKTEILINAKDTPTTANKSLKNQKALAKGMMKHMHVTISKAASMEFRIPIFGRKDARMNEQIAIGRSLKPSSTLAWDLEIPKFCCTCKITVPTEFRRMAKTK